MSLKSVVAVLLNYDHRQEGQLQALRALHERCDEVDYLALSATRGMEGANLEFIEAIRFAKPDWVWMQLQETDVIRPETLNRIREEFPTMPLVHWMGDMRDDVPSYLASICRSTHMTLASNRGHLQRFRDVGAPRAEYMQIGLDWREDVLGQPAWEPPFKVPEVVLCGNFYGDRFGAGTSERMNAVKTLTEHGIDIGVVGNNWPGNARVVGRCDVKQQYHVYQRAKVALNVNHYNDVESYYSDRQLIAMASGRPVVCRRVPGLEREFKDGIHCLSYELPNELVDAVKRLLDDQALAARIGAEGRAEVMRNHSWYSRFLNLLPIVEQIKRDLG